MAEVSPITVSPEELAEMEKRNELRLKIKEEHLAALQLEGRRRDRMRSSFQGIQGRLLISAGTRRTCVVHTY